MSALSFLFVRHGRTHDNARGVLQGHLGRGLDETGRAQIARVAEVLRTRRPRAIVSSDLERAHETAQIIAGGSGIEVTLDPAFREVDIGAWSGLTLEEVAERFPEEHAAWHEGKDVARGGGETYAQVAARMYTATMERARVHTEGPIVIVSHGTAIRALTARILGLKPQRFPQWPVMANGGVTTITVEKGAPRLITWNEASHLEE